jgi:hypothetical protein
VLLTSLELDRDRLICTLHQKPAMPVSPAPILGVFGVLFSMRQTREACEGLHSLPDELHRGGSARGRVRIELRVIVELVQLAMSGSPGAQYDLGVGW